MKYVSAALWTFVLLCWVQAAKAAPQAHGAVAIGLCAVERETARTEFPRFSGVLRGELWFGRERDRDLGLGPLVSLSTASFDRYAVTAGASLVLPISPTYPFILSATGGALETDAGWAPGVEAWLFWGPMSYNFHSSYAMASGLLLGFQTSLGEERLTIVSLNGQLDLGLVALPFILTEQWLVGGSEN